MRMWQTLKKLPMWLPKPSKKSIILQLKIALNICTRIYLESQKIGEKRSIFEYFFRVQSLKQNNENLGSHMLIQPYLQNFVTT